VRSGEEMCDAICRQWLCQSVPMSELRQDPTTGGWVIIAPGRAHRPHQIRVASAISAAVPRDEERCPFCPGNEALLPGIVDEIKSDNPPGWLVRVVPNKFPALTRNSATERSIPADPHALPGYGVHEVVIESPRHDAVLSSMEDHEISAVVSGYHQRVCALSRISDIKTIVLFHNCGAASGASLVHPHAQVVALPLVTPRSRAMLEWGDRQGRETGRCPTCAELERVLQHRDLVVEETECFLALVPFAAERPFEQWLVPKRHHCSFDDANADELDDLALLLRRALQRLRIVHHDAPYSFAIESGGHSEKRSRYLHWRLRIAPELVTWAGFELGSGMPINPSQPEKDAQELRAARTAKDPR